MLATSFKKDLEVVAVRLRQRAKTVDSIAVAIELYKNQRFRDGRLRQYPFLRKLLIASLEQKEKERQEFKSRLGQWLGSADADNILQGFLANQASGTCEWIWTNPIFQDWTCGSSFGTDRLLCIIGPTGCGKSVLVSSVIRVMKRRGNSTLYFSFPDENADQKTYSRLVRSLLWQLYQNLDSEEAFAIVRQLMGDNVRTTSGLKAAFAHLASQLSTPLLLVLDGLEECEEPIREVIGWMTELLNTFPIVHAIIVGTSHILETSSLCQHVLEITPALIQADIDIFLHSSIHDSSSLQTFGLKDLVFATLQERSQGMFLWVKLMLDDLNKPASKAEVIQRLHNLPSVLEERYHRICVRLVRSLDDLDLKFMNNILQIVATARRALSLNEIQNAQAILSWMARTPSGPKHIDDYVVPDLITRLQSTCGSLLCIRDGCAFIAHSSLLEYLRKATIQRMSRDGNRSVCFAYNDKTTHGLLALTCLTVLEQSTYEIGLNHNHQLYLSGSYALISYAARNAIYHLNRADLSCSSTMEQFERFVGSFNANRWCFFLNLYLLLDLNSGWDLHEIMTFLNQWPIEDGNTDVSETTYQDERRTSDAIIQHFCQNGTGNARIAIHTTVHDSRPKILCLDDKALKTAQGQDTSCLLAPLEQIMLLLEINDSAWQHYLSKTRLQAILDVVLEQIPTHSTYSCLMVGDLCQGYRKYATSLKVFQAALANPKNRNTPIEYLLHSSMALSQSCLGLHQDAESSYRYAIQGQALILGPEHKETLRSQVGLAWALGQQGKFKESEHTLRRLLKTRKGGCDRIHQESLDLMVFLVWILEKQKRWQEAEEVCRELIGKESTLITETHPDTLTSTHELCCILFQQEKFEEAAALNAKVVRMAKESLGCQNNLTLCAIASLAIILMRQRRFKEAANHLRFTMNKATKSSNSAYQRVSKITFRLGKELYDHKRFEEAAEMLLLAAKRCAESFGPKHKDTLVAMNLLAATRIAQKKFKKAEGLLRRVIRERSNTNGEDHALTLEAKCQLEVALSRQRKYAEAEVALKAVAEKRMQASTVGIRKIHDADLVWTLRAMHTLVRIYYQQGKRQEAADIYWRAVDMEDEVVKADDKSDFAVFVKGGR